jgi:hypothetical protein
MADTQQAREAQIAQKLSEVDGVWLARLEQTFPPDALERLTRAEYDYYSTHGDYVPGLAKLALHYLARVSSLTADLALANEEIRIREESQIPVIPRAAAEQLSSLTAERDTLRDALQTYGYHRVTCHLWPKQNTGRCTCGFDAALAAPSGNPSESEPA